MKNKKPLLSKGDLITIGILLLAAAVLFALRGGEGTVATVTVDGETVYTVDLSDVTDTRDVDLGNGVTVTVEPGSIRFSSSTCAGHDCILTGRLTKAGQCAVCLPNKTVIRITGDKPADMPDAIT